LILVGQKGPDPKGILDNFLTSALFETIVLVVQSLECSFLSPIPNDLRIHTLTSRIRVLALNLNCLALSKTTLDPFRVKRIQKILTNVPICTPTYDSLFLLLRIVWSDISTSSKFVDGVFVPFRGKDLISKIIGPQSVIFIAQAQFKGKTENEIMVPFFEAFAEAFELMLLRHRELVVKLLESFAVHFCEMGHAR
jgi:uncharacterized membrane protein